MIDARGYLRDIYNAILFRDILRRHKLRNPQMLSDVSRLLMESHALEVSYANIANRLGIKSVHTVQTYAGYLESWPNPEVAKPLRGSAVRSPRRGTDSFFDLSALDPIVREAVALTSGFRRPLGLSFRTLGRSLPVASGPV